jgi:hypothetical protein
MKNVNSVCLAGVSDFLGQDCLSGCNEGAALVEGSPEVGAGLFSLLSLFADSANTFAEISKTRAQAPSNSLKFFGSGIG